MTKTTGAFLALIVVGIAVTTGGSGGSRAAGPVCPATSSSQNSQSGQSSHAVSGGGR